MVETAQVEVGTPVAELPTPALLVDLDRLRRNLDRWQEAITANGVLLRPHIKTHKIPTIAAMQLARGAPGIASAKPSEAQVFADDGVADIVIAYPVFGTGKWAQIAGLAATGARVTVNVDNALAAQGLSDAAEERGARVGVQLEVDSGLGRVGLRPDELDELLALGRLVESLTGLELQGVTTHRGVGFPGASELTPAEAGRQEGEIIVGVAEELRDRGLGLAEVTAGGTITGQAVATVPGVTEVRAGTYVFNDLMQLGFGSASEDDLALTILCTVVSHHGDRATVDGGSKTFSGDVRVAREGATEFTAVARAADRPAYVERVTEEHGVIDEGAELLGLGERVTFYPAHVCTCVNLSDTLYGVRDGVVAEVWPVLARGKRS